MATTKAPETNLGIVTSWMPITTAHPSVNGCSDLIYSYVANTIAAFDPGYGLDVADSSCLPKAATTWWNQGRLGRNTDTVLLIGPITCPEAYFTAKTSVKDSSSTLVACCPVGYKFSGFQGVGNTNQCVSELDAGKIITYGVRDASNNWQITTKTIKTNTPIYGIQVNGWLFAQETGSATDASNACTATATTVDGGVAHPTSAVDPGLSSGAKAGIGVGVAMGVIGLLSLLAGLWMMRRARRRNQDQGTQVVEHDPRYPAGYGGWPIETASTPAMAKSGMATTTEPHPLGGDYGASPQSGYSHYPSMSDGPSPSAMGGSTLGGGNAPFEIGTERPTELPASTTPAKAN